MQSRYIRDLRLEGFVLLHALWIMILASFLAMSVMATSVGLARDSEVANAALQVELAAESAVHRVLFDLLRHDSRHLWPRRGRTGSVQIGGAEVIVSIVDVSGLVDINRADDRILHRIFLAALPLEDAATFIASIKAAKPISDYSSLVAIGGGSSKKFASLQPYITLFSGRAVPAYDEAPDWVSKALDLKPEPRGVLSDASSFSGNVLRIEAVARSKKVVSRRLFAEVLLTGRLDQPYWIYDWRWQPLNERLQEV